MVVANFAFIILSHESILYNNLFIIQAKKNAEIFMHVRMKVSAVCFSYFFLYRILLTAMQMSIVIAISGSVLPITISTFISSL